MKRNCGGLVEIAGLGDIECLAHSLGRFLGLALDALGDRGLAPISSVSQTLSSHADREQQLADVIVEIGRNALTFSVDVSTDGCGGSNRRSHHWRQVDRRFFEQHFGSVADRPDRAQPAET